MTPEIARDGFYQFPNLDNDSKAKVLRESLMHQVSVFTRKQGYQPNALVVGHETFNVLRADKESYRYFTHNPMSTDPCERYMGLLVLRGPEPNSCTLAWVGVDFGKELGG